MEAGVDDSYDTFEMINIATGAGLVPPVRRAVVSGVSVGVRVFPARHGELRF
ncbi:MAG: hypothetical protein ACLRZH_00885 [Ruthenibacterium lactatiformans]